MYKYKYIFYSYVFSVFLLLIFMSVYIKAIQLQLFYQIMFFLCLYLFIIVKKVKYFILSYLKLYFFFNLRFAADQRRADADGSEEPFSSTPPLFHRSRCRKNREFHPVYQPQQGSKFKSPLDLPNILFNMFVGINSYDFLTRLFIYPIYK